MKLDDREVATVLAGLRLLQNPRTFVPSQIEEIASKGGWCWSIYQPDLDPLDPLIGTIMHIPCGMRQILTSNIVRAMRWAQER